MNRLCLAFALTTFTTTINAASIGKLTETYNKYQLSFGESPSAEIEVEYTFMKDCNNVTDFGVSVTDISSINMLLEPHVSSTKMACPEQALTETTLNDTITLHTQGSPVLYILAPAGMKLTVKP